MPDTSRKMDLKEGIKLRGLPWSATPAEIVEWFGDIKVRNGAKGVHIVLSKEGRPSGEAYVKMETEQDVVEAVKKHQEHMGHRYIEVYRMKTSEMNIGGQEPYKMSGDSFVIRMRGLPYECSIEEVIQFFEGLEIVPNGICLMKDFDGRSTGEAFVQFCNRESAEGALNKHKDTIGHRYIEIFRSSETERESSVAKMRHPIGSSRPGPYDRPGTGAGRGRPSGGRGGGPGPIRPGRGDWNSSRPSFGGGSNARRGEGGSTGGGFRGTGHRVRMRGLPFKASMRDVADFFYPVVPVNIDIQLDNKGRAVGEADVDFETHEDAVEAMGKDKQNMEHRYIELFLESAPGNPFRSGGDRFGSGPDIDRFGDFGGDRFGPGPDDDRFGLGSGGDRFGVGSDRDRFEPSFDRFGAGSAGDRFGPGPGGDRFSPGPGGDRFGPSSGGDRFGPGPTGDRFGPGPGGDRFGSGSGGRFASESMGDERYGSMGGDRFGSGGNRLGSAQSGDRYGPGPNEPRYGSGAGDRFGPDDRFSSGDRFGSGVPEGDRYGQGGDRYGAGREERFGGGSPTDRYVPTNRFLPSSGGDRFNQGADRGGFNRGDTGGYNRGDAGGYNRGDAGGYGGGPNYGGSNEGYVSRDYGHSVTPPRYGGGDNSRSWGDDANPQGRGGKWDDSSRTWGSSGVNTRW